MIFFDRLIKFIEYKGENINSFTLKLGFGSGLLAKAIKNNSSLGSDKLMKIFQSYPELSPDWLLTGTGSMLRNIDANYISEPPGLYNKICKFCHEKDNEIERLKKLNERNEKIIDALLNKKA
jgi:hypothetical protein